VRRRPVRCADVWLFDPSGSPARRPQREQRGLRTYYASTYDMPTPAYFAFQHAGAHVAEPCKSGFMFADS